MNTVVNLTPNLKRAVVYKNGAQLNYAADLSNTTFNGGEEYALHVEGSWEAKDQKSLLASIKGVGAERLILKAVRFRTVKTVDDQRPRVRELQAAIVVQQDSVRDAQDTLDGTEYRISCIRRVLNKFANAGCKMLPNDAYDPAKWAVLSVMAERQLTDLTIKCREQEAAVKVLREELERMNAELRQLVSYRNGGERVLTNEVAEVVLTVEGDTPVAGSGLMLEVSYVVSNASWAPVYDVRVNSETHEVTLAYNAIVKQSTVEDWSDVELQLSTANPQFGGDPPALTPWRIGIERPSWNTSRNENTCDDYDEDVAVDMMVMMERNEELSVASSSSSKMKKMSSRRSVKAAPARVEAAAVTKSTTALTFTIPGRHNIGNGGESVKVAVAHLPLQGEFEYVCVPKMSQSTYLQVRCTNNSPFSLLPGRTNVFSDNQLIGTATMDLVAPGEDFWAHLGIDDSMEVTRTEVHVKEMDTSSFMSGKRTTVEFRFCYVVKNTRAVVGDAAVPTNTRLLVRDQYPLSEDRDCVVSVVEPKIKKVSTSSSAAAVPSNQQPFSYSSTSADGNSIAFDANASASRLTLPSPPTPSSVETTEAHEIVWTLENLVPGEERMFNYVFTVEHGADMETVGL